MTPTQTAEQAETCRATEFGVSLQGDDAVTIARFCARPIKRASYAKCVVPDCGAYDVEHEEPPEEGDWDGIAHDFQPEDLWVHTEKGIEHEAVAP